ncbi:MAG: hypothetical protein H7301_12415 [Cryobacterium sp.]|nr:hypothetical protein [Oligoflexia bacterium]
MTDVSPEGDESEVLKLLPSTWLAWRLEWARYNAQMQYQAMLQGEASPELMARGGALSYMFGQIEKHLDAETIYWLYKLAADPIPAVKQKVDLSRKLIETTSRSARQLRSIIEKMYSLKGSRSNDISSGDNLRRQLNDFTNEAALQFSRTSGIPAGDLLDSIELMAVSKLTGFQLKVVVSANNQLGEENVPSDVAECFRATANLWLDEVLYRSSEKNGEERTNAEKSEHLNLECTVWKEQNYLYFSIKDDGLGKTQITIDPSTWNALALRLESKQDPGKGSELRVRCTAAVNAVEQFLVFEIHHEGGKRLFSIPSYQMCSVENQARSGLKDQRYGLYRSNADEILSEIDLGQKLLSQPLPSEQAIRLIVKNKEGDPIALRVSDVTCMIQGKIKTQSIPYLKNVPILGFVLHNGEYLCVLDIDLLIAA